MSTIPHWRAAQRPLIAYDPIEEAPIDRTAPVKGRYYGSEIAQAAKGTDSARIPAWLLQVLVIILTVTVVFMAFEVRDLRDRLATQETYTQNTREKLAANGWEFLPDGSVIKRNKENK